MKKGKSALFSLTVAILSIVFAQIALIGGTLIASHVMSKLDDNAYEIFSQTVKTRAGYIEGEMYNRWSEIDVFVNALAAAYPTDTATDEDRLAYLETAAPTLITMLRETDTTGSFVILNDNAAPDSAHSCLYFIDSDPGYNDLQNNSDLMLLKGPIEFLNEFQIPMHIVWNYGLTLNDNNRALFDRPYFAGKTMGDAQHLGYWGIADALADPDSKTITYTKPLIAADGEVFGVAGVEISQDYLYRLLPQEELSDDGYSGYAIVGDGADGIEPLIVQGAMLRKALPYGKSVNLRLENEATGSYSILADGMRLSAHCEQLPLYNRNTPFSGTRWYVMGVTGEASLTRYSENLTKILTTAMSVSLLIGIAFAVLMGFFFSKPLKELEAQIHSFRPGDKLRLTPTGVLEIDALSQAVEQLNEDVLNSVLKTDKIIDMVNLDIGSFEYKTGDETVKVSATLAAMLCLPRSEEGYVDKTVFANCLHRIKERPTEDHLYAFGSNPVKWLKLEDVTTDSGEFGIVMDATRDELARLALKRDRDFDALTGIYNRFAFQRVMNQLFAERDFTHAAFIMCDLDNLKHVNDIYGHDAGDRYIRATAAFFTRYFRGKRALYARMSGDEFYIFLHGYDSVEEIRDIVFGMHRALGSESIPLPDGSIFRLKMSSGVAWYPESSREPEELMRYADFAMYQGKHTIKGGIREFDSQIYQEQSYLFTGKEELYSVLDEQLFSYVFQPIVSAADGSIYGYEALMRPGGKTLNSPDKLLNLAQLEGQLYKVERNTFYAVLGLASLYRDLFQKCKLFLNSVPNQVLKEAEYEELTHLYADCLDCLVIEITESESINDASLCRKKDLVKRWGALLALDDYGTGYANDMLLLNLEPNLIKIDRFLVDGIETDKNKRDLVKKTIAFAAERGIAVLAEGVETESQLRVLLAAGIDLIQGYYVAKPMPLPNFDCTEIARTIGAIREGTGSTGSTKDTPTF